MPAGIFLDGLHPIRRPVGLAVEDGALRLSASEGAELARWPVAEVRRMERRGTVEVFGREGEKDIGAERLELAEPGAIELVAAACPRLDHKPRSARRSLLRLAGFGALSLCSLAFLLLVGVPLMADRLGPLVPSSIEASIGRATDAQLRLMLRGGGRGRFECASPAGQAALDALTARLTEGVGFALPPRVAVIDIEVPNAVALPGGRIYLFRGLIERATHPDDIVSVLAHELGHVHARHSMRAVLQVGSTSFLAGLVFGDFAGAGAMALVTRSLINAGYSRDNEREADAFATQTMLRIGGDPRALARLLGRVSQEHGGEERRSYFDSHPVTPDRAAAIEAQVAGRPVRGASMAPEAWEALRTICS